MWDVFKDFIFWGMDACYRFIGDWGLAIIVATLIFRFLLMPLMQKQIKSSYKMNKFSPMMQELQEKYADDPQRLSEETRKLYSESGFNPVAGCLPLFLQMPIFIAVFQVLRDEMSWRVGDASAGYNFLNIVPDLTVSPAAALEQGFMVFLPYIILLLLFAGLTFAPMIIQQRNQTGQQAQQMIIMSVVMTIMMLFIGWGSPAGVLLFWATSSLFGVCQQQITTRLLKREDEQAEAEVIDLEPVKVDVVRKQRKKRPTKKR
ncbi:MAG: YidC/Oxa1 family membrane protein insertase [Coriobacteriia bacterium]|nr:YidC/Oxa1 family membrane protein insertase [Coriobacteriia bacterium]